MSVDHSSTPSASIRVSITGNDQCWEWLGAKNNDGRGMVTFNGSSMSSARAFWLLMYGNIPGGMQVLHRCDNRLCCNPFHLFLGSALDNSQDMVNKGRSTKGESHGRAKLTQGEALAIRSDPRPRKIIAKEYGISDIQVGNIRRGKSWRHL